MPHYHPKIGMDRQNTWLFGTYKWDSMTCCLEGVLTYTPGSTGLGCDVGGKLQSCTGSQLPSSQNREHSEKQGFFQEGVAERCKAQPNRPPSS